MRDIWQHLKKIAGTNIFPMLCYLLAAYFFYAFCLIVGIPPAKPLDTTGGSYLALAVFLFMLPEAKKLKLGKLFEYEARVKEIKEDVKQFKEETRTTLSAYTSLISAISNTVSQTVNVNLPGREEESRARAELNTTLKTKTGQPQLQDEIDRFLASEGNDLNYALAKLRMELEFELRRILGKRTESNHPVEKDMKFLSVRSLFSQFTQKFPKYEAIGNSFDYVLRVCNAAIHGQYVPERYAHEALTMGFRMLEELKNIPPN
jgi:hypothetical protein